eukprot:4812500-Pleurochrysis_carterae.AAC.4
MQSANSERAAPCTAAPLPCRINAMSRTLVHIVVPQSNCVERAAAVSRSACLMRSRNASATEEMACSEDTNSHSFGQRSARDRSGEASSSGANLRCLNAAATCRHADMWAYAGGLGHASGRRAWQYAFALFDVTMVSADAEQRTAAVSGNGAARGRLTSKTGIVTEGRD